MKTLILIVLVLLAACIWYWYTADNPGNTTLPISETDSLINAPVKKRTQRIKHNKVVNMHIDSLAVHKAERNLLAFSKQKLIKTYRVALGINPVGKKEVEGDYKTPEGHYYIRSKNPFSTYHKSLGISYPNQEDIKNAEALGKHAGGDIMIHGLMKKMNNTGKDHIKSDWTFGCIAVTNQEIDELFAQVKTGTPIMITP